jgi:TrmH family RNA methyltransferase
MINRISSPKNPNLKKLLALQKSSERKSTGLFPIEGLKEAQLAISSGYEIESVFYCPDFISKDDIQMIHSTVDPISGFFEVGKSIFRKIAYREGSGGIVMIALQKKIELWSLYLSAIPLIVVLEKVEKPGNLGAILRTADAAAIDAVIICDPQTDIYNPNVVRSSIGCLFTKQVAISDSLNTYHWLRSKGICIYATSLEASDFYHKADFTIPSALVLGTESTGLTDFWTKHADARIKIPMLGKIDSMNVSTAAAVVIFEAKKQRDFK